MQLLEKAREELEQAQRGAGVRLEDALVEAADTIDDQQAKIAAARTGDEDEAGATGETDRSAWFPTYRAA